MITPNLPTDCTPVVENGIQLNDQGRRVIVNSLGGALVNHGGVVLYGPYTFTYTALDTQTRRGKLVLAPRKFTTQRYWCVQIDGRTAGQVNLVESELTFA